MLSLSGRKQSVASETTASSALRARSGRGLEHPPGASAIPSRAADGTRDNKKKWGVPKDAPLEGLTGAAGRYSVQSVCTSPIDHQLLELGLVIWMRMARIVSRGNESTVLPEAPGLLSTIVLLKFTPSCDV